MPKKIFGKGTIFFASMQIYLQKLFCECNFNVLCVFVCIIISLAIIKLKALQAAF